MEKKTLTIIKIKGVVFVLDGEVTDYEVLGSWGDCLLEEGEWVHQRCWFKGGQAKDCDTVCLNKNMKCTEPNWNLVPKDCELHKRFGWSCGDIYCLEIGDNVYNTIAPFRDAMDCWYYRTGAVNTFDCSASMPMEARVCPCM